MDESSSKFAAYYVEPGGINESNDFDFRLSSNANCCGRRIVFLRLAYRMRDILAHNLAESRG